MFNLQGKDVLLKDNHTYKIKIKDSTTDQLLKEIPFRPGWKIHTYNFFQRKPNRYDFRPYYTVKNFIDLMKNNQKEVAASYIYNKRVDEFSWSNLNHEYFKSADPHVEYYIGDYLEYKNVFAIDLLYFDAEKREQKSGEEFAKQTIYLIDYFGTWKIIDVMPLEYTDQGKKN